VAPDGFAYGVDFLDEMGIAARKNALEAGVENVKFLTGDIENVPLPSDSVDAVISNCVINLAPDKAPVFAEIERVLRPGGRFALSDVVAANGAVPEDGADWAGCGAGALQYDNYLRMLSEAGLRDVSIEFTHETSPGLHGAIVRGRAAE
jgi:ubiquinone/menaquinone biosynthesis C-methylase UbiE